MLRDALHDVPFDLKPSIVTTVPVRCALDRVRGLDSLFESELFAERGGKEGGNVKNELLRAFDPVGLRVATLHRKMRIDLYNAI